MKFSAKMGKLQVFLVIYNVVRLQSTVSTELN